MLPPAWPGVQRLRGDMPGHRAYRLLNYTAGIFDAIWRASARREGGTHLALHLEANDVTCRRAAEEGIALRQGERTPLDYDRIWEDEAGKIAHRNALAAIAGSKGGRSGTATDGEGSKRRIADQQVVHSKTCNGEIRGHALRRGKLDFDGAAGFVRYDEVRRCRRTLVYEETPLLLAALWR